MNYAWREKEQAFRRRLGLKDLIRWNQACLIQHIRSFLRKEGSLWIAWIYAYVIKEASFWHLPNRKWGSWTWQSILKLREVARDALSIQKQSFSNIWRETRRKKEKVKWYRLLWHSLNVPKISVITLMAKLDRLPTKEKLGVIGLNVD